MRVKLKTSNPHHALSQAPAWERHTGSSSFLRPTQLPRILNHPQLARSLVQLFLVIGKLELPEQVTQAGAWVTAYFSFCDYD